MKYQLVAKFMIGNGDFMKKMALIIVSLCLSIGAWADSGRIGQWNISRDTSPIDDSKSIYVYVMADSSLRDDWGNTRRPSLVFRCVENRTDAFINFDGAFVSSHLHSGQVTFRIDSEKAFTLNVNSSTDNKALFIPRPINFIKSLLGHERLLARTGAGSGGDLTPIFNISDLEDAIKELRETCHW